MGVNPKIGGNPPKWMVKIMENPIKIDDLGGKKNLFLETPISKFYISEVHFLYMCCQEQAHREQKITSYGDHLKASCFFLFRGFIWIGWHKNLGMVVSS